MNSDEIKAFINEHYPLFWFIPENARENISLNLLVETILQYGDIPDIRRLIELIGLKKIAAIFNQQVLQRRCNYHPRTINYFKLYFSKYAS
jgi:hypothetical protein